MAAPTTTRQRTDAALRKVVLRSLTGGTNLAVLGSGMVATLLLGSWALLALGVVAYGALVAWDLTSPTFVRKVIAGDAAAPRALLPEPARLRDPVARRALQGIVAARGELATVLAATPDEVKGYLDAALASIGDLEERAGRLALRADELATYLAGVDLARLQSDVRRLTAEAERATDPDTRREYQSARQAREERLRAITDVASARDRIIARLESVAAALEGLPAKIVRMKALDAQAMDHLSGDIAGELSSFNSEIRSFEETLAAVGEAQAS